MSVLGLTYSSSSPWSRDTDKFTPFRSIPGKPFTFIPGFTPFCLISYLPSRFYCLSCLLCWRVRFEGNIRIPFLYSETCLNHFHSFLTSSLMVFIPVLWVISIFLILSSYQIWRSFLKQHPSIPRNLFPCLWENFHILHLLSMFHKLREALRKPTTSSHSLLQESYYWRWQRKKLTAKKSWQRKKADSEKRWQSYRLRMRFLWT